MHSAVEYKVYLYDKINIEVGVKCLVEGVECSLFILSHNLMKFGIARVSNEMPFN